MFCNKCGNKLADSALFCNACGQRVVRSTPTVPVTPVVPVAPVESVVSVAPAEPVSPAPVAEESIPHIPVDEIPAPVAVEEPMEADVPPVEVPSTPGEGFTNAPIAEQPAPAMPQQPVYSPVQQPQPMYPPVQQPQPMYPPVQQSQPMYPPVQQPQQPMYPPVQQPQPMYPPVQPPVYPPVQQPEKPAKAPRQKTSKRLRRMPRGGIRTLLQILSFLMCVVLMLSLGTALVTSSMRKVLSQNGLQQMMNTMIEPANNKAQVSPVVDLVYQQIEQNTDVEIPFSAEDLQYFVEQSTMKDYVEEKLAGYVEDFIYGTEETSISTEEIMDLLYENRGLLAEELNVNLDMANVEKELNRIIEREDLNGTIRQEVDTKANDLLKDSVGMNLRTFRKNLQTTLSDSRLYLAIGLSALLVVVLFLLNYYHLSNGLLWTSIAGITVGCFTALPLLVLRFASDAVASLYPDAAAIVDVVSSFVPVIAPVYYAVLIGSVALVVVSIVWSILTRSRRE